MSKGGSVYNQSAQALQGAGGLYGDAAALYGKPGSYNASTVAAPQVAAPATIASGIKGYMNPYTDDVINRTSADVQRQTDLQTNQIGANADAVGAFGGSRLGIQEALTNSEGQKNIGDISATLRNTGFNTAAGLSGQDIANTIGVDTTNTNLMDIARRFNAGATDTASQFGLNQDLARGAGLGGIASGAMSLGQTGFDMGQAIGNTQMQQGSLQQALIQAIMSGAAGQFQGFTESPSAALEQRMKALGLNPLSQATTTTGSYTPGLFDYASLAAGMYGMSQMGT